MQWVQEFPEGTRESDRFNKIAFAITLAVLRDDTALVEAQRAGRATNQKDSIHALAEGHFKFCDSHRRFTGVIGGISFNAVERSGVLRARCGLRGAACRCGVDGENADRPPIPCSAWEVHCAPVECLAAFGGADSDGGIPRDQQAQAGSTTADFTAGSTAACKRGVRVADLLDEIRVRN